MSKPWEKHPIVLRATRTIRSLQLEISTTTADRASQIGGLLALVKSQLEHGEWLRWLSEGAHIDDRTAARYITVSDWANANVVEFKKVRTSSLSKIYRLLGVDPKVRRQLYDRRVLIPGTDRRVTLEEMTLAELERVLREMMGGAAETKTDPIAGLIKTTRRRVDAMRAHTDTLIQLRSKVDAKAVAELHSELLDIAERLQLAFRL